MPTLDRKNILEGFCYVYVGAGANAATPDVMPADTVPFGGTLGGTWRGVGYTSEDGASESFSRERGEVRTAQDRSPVLRPTTGYGDMVTFTTLESTLENIRDAVGRGTITTTPPVGGVPGFKQLRLTDNAGEEELAVLIEGIAPPNDGGAPRRIFFPLVEATGTVTLNQRLGEAGANSGVAFELTRVGSGANSEPIIRDILL